jgi:hypothetical protein|tara:strand:+ start:54 stop:302 length:249 start_codon:yes stop_codon:yes gene_type:complete
MSQVINLKGVEGTLVSDSNVGFATLVRVLNNKTSVQVITQKAAGGAVLANVTLAAGEVLYIKKAPSDTLLGLVTSLAVAVAQ